MQLGPRQHQPKLPTPEAAVDHLDRIDPDLRTRSCVTGVKMWRPVTVEEHRDHDLEETADRRHAADPASRLGQRSSGPRRQPAIAGKRGSRAPARFRHRYEDSLGDPDTYARLNAGYSRGFGESTLRLHLFGPSARNAGEVDTLTEEFFGRLTRHYQAKPGQHASETMIMTIVLGRR
jgi:hypothetical protein